MTPLGGIIGSQAGDGAPPPAQVFEVLVRVAARLGAKVEGGACHGVALEAPSDSFGPKLKQIKDGNFEVPEGWGMDLHCSWVGGGWWVRGTKARAGLTAGISDKPPHASMVLEVVEDGLVPLASNLEDARSLEKN